MEIENVKNRFSQLENVEFEIEKTFNTLGYIPVVGSASSPFRLVMGQLQQDIGVLGVLFFATTAIIDAVTGNSADAGVEGIQRSFSQVLHGCGNIGRSALEALPLLPLITCLPYDQIARMKYTGEYETRDEAIPHPGL